jgi:hypothetical protein
MRLATLNALGPLTGTFAVERRFGLISSEATLKRRSSIGSWRLSGRGKKAQTMKPGILVAGAAFAILFAGCAVEHDSGKQQTGLAQSDVSRYVAAMSEQPGQLALKHQCGHERSWNRLEGLSTENE